jgi:hypothetical protein
MDIRLAMVTDMNSQSRKLGKDRPGKQLAIFGWFGLLFLLLNASCGDGAPDWREALSRETSGKPNSSPGTVKTTNELIVYLDESGSMAGYVNRDGQTVFGKALRELRFATGTFAGSDVRVLVRHVGSQIGAPLPDMDLTTASQDPSVYHAGETNLAGAISSFKVGYQNVVAKPGMGSNGDQSAVNDPPDPPPPARFQVLVTDGVQSTKKGSTVQDCTAGSDQFCVRQKIAELLNAGWAGVVLGIRSDFHGKVYSEVSGAAIPFETRSNSLATFRPFYLYIFSPDAKSLDALVRSLKDRLRPLVNNCADCIRELNLSFPYTDGFADFEITIPKESREALQKARNQGGPPPRFTIHVDVDTEGSAPKPFAIQIRMPWSSHALDAGDTQELVRLLSWDVRPVFPFNDTKERVRFSDLKILRSHLEGDQIVLDATTAFQPGNGRPAWRVYSVEAKVNFNQASPGWIRNWSTDLDTKPEAANRTFNLETALLGLWNNSMAKDQVVAQAYLRIGPN